ncbi:NAD(P)H-hydrate epimerase [Singulisphaera sp. PoT]|uniref:NAD(P)H-hydrate epimerase n=1 Tax=Singulisphaera sp. PoT TaxID=3411797 RepID=UPI003BF5EE55
MKIRPLARDEVRSIDERAARELGLSTLVLMENAGRGAAAWLRDQGVGPSSKVWIACGPGNNGGDGGVVARHLDSWGVAVRVVWFAKADQLRGDAAAQWKILEKSGIDQVAWDAEARGGLEPLAGEIAAADWLVDGLLGTGLTRPVEGVLHDLIDRLNHSGRPILALDLPSGLDADSGRPLGIAIKARATVTFVAPKLGFSAEGAAGYTGEVSVVEIGVPRRSLEPFIEAR